MGPFVFAEWHHKDKIRANPANFTVTYQQYKVWNYLPEKSVGSLNDVITTLNPPAAYANGEKENKIKYFFFN